jgi:hypothetical protein
MSYNNYKKTDREWYLEQQIDDERRWRQEAEDRHQEETRRRRAQLAEAFEYELRTANNWRDAIGKQIRLAQRERESGLEWLKGWQTDSFFSETVAACRRALEIWPSREKEVAAEIAALEGRIVELKEQIRLNVGAQLAAEKQHNSPGWASVAATLSDPEQDCESWLSW